MIDLSDLHLQRDMLHAHNGNVMRLLQGCRARDGSFNRAVVAYTINGARNALEGALADLDKIEAECISVCAEREQISPLLKVFDHRRSRAKFSDATLPATVSPAGAA